MPWHRKPKKDVASCDNPRSGARTRHEPRVSERDNPEGPEPLRRPAEHMGRAGATRGTETSKYPEEEKSNETPRVAASERGPGQTGGRASAAGVVGAGHMGPGEGERNGLGWPARQG